MSEVYRTKSGRIITDAMIEEWMEASCPPCSRDQHEHCYNIQLADAGPAGYVCECSHETSAVVFGGYTEDQLREAFRLVKNCIGS
jgi:hypothetical protein